MIHLSKSLVPDGIHAGFYHTYWHVVGTDVIDLVLKCLNGELHIRDLNATSIVLIPKTKTQETMTKFRSISLCRTTPVMAVQVCEQHVIQDLAVCRLL